MMLRLLIVEDQPAVREVVAEIVGEINAEVNITQVSSLEKARCELVGHSWNGLITDMSLGDGNALELMESLVNEDITLPPTILMSGFLTSARNKQAMDLGIEHILSKPFAPDILLECLEQLLHQELKERCKKEKPKRPARSSDRLLPEMFAMDRRLGLVNRMFDEISSQKEVSSICASALNLAIDIVHAEAGYLALFERKQHTLVLVASQDMDDAPVSCRLEETAFKPLIYGDEALLQSSHDCYLGVCWPGLDEPDYVAIPVRLQGISMGVLCLMRPTLTAPVNNETRQMLDLLVKELDTLLDNRAVHAALAENMRETLIALVRSLEARDRYTRDHSARVGALSAIFSQDMGLDQDHVDLIRTGGLLHDIGKCGIPDAILLKPGRYTEQEFAIMKAHPAIGDNILRNMDTMARERLMLRHHHERFDGLGYPDRLAGEQIPFDARIVCVADAIDAMTTHRVYRMARPLSFCLEQLKSNSGTQFDPTVIEVAIAAVERGLVKTQAEEKQQKNTVMPLSALISVNTEVRHYA